MTRRRLEAKITEVQKMLDDAISLKDYKAAGPFHDEVQRLTDLRKEYPTLEELKLSVSHAEEAVAIAARKRDFANAASLQAEVDEAKRRFDTAILDEDWNDECSKKHQATATMLNLDIDGFESRADLEDEIASLHTKIEEAIAKKDFKSASEFQSKVDEREKLRSFFPSLEDLQSELQSAKARLEEAISVKDFGKAEKLHDEIDQIERRIESERAKCALSPTMRSHGGSAAWVIGLDGTKVTIESRFVLEEEIAMKKSMQSEEISSKNFKKAQELQGLIDKLEGLRSVLPTVAELKKRVKEKKADMNRAISEKRFADAEQFDVEIVLLEEKLTIEEIHRPVLTSPPKKTATSIYHPNISASKPKPSDLSVHSVPVTKNSVAARKAKAGSVVVATPIQRARAKPPTFVAATQKGNDIKDDISDVTSVRSSKSENAKSKIIRAPKKARDLEPHAEEDRSVSKLRPKKPLISSVNDSVLSLTQMLASKRGDASLVVGDDGSLSGIITDTDITRRLVARHLDASSTTLSQVMTPNPLCVSMADAALDAMSIMVENHFRHLPVVDENGGVVGLLDIAKCLNDAISKLERTQAKQDTATQAAVKAALTTQGAQGSQAAVALHALLGPLISQAFGTQSSPTLRSLLAGKPSTIVAPNTSVLEAGISMAESRKAALVVDEGKLVGIFGFKDMMNRVVAKNLQLEDTMISTVMTPNPEAVSPEMTVLESLQTMHDNKFLTLPVCEGDGTVVGLVNVMDVIYGCGGAEGWRSVFSSALELDDLSDDASTKSGVVSAKGGGKSVRSITSVTASPQEKEDSRPVSTLRPKKALISSIHDSVLSVTQMLASKRGDASLIVDDKGALAGIVTDTDVTRRLVAKHLNSSLTDVGKIMTSNPTCVLMTSSAMAAMTTMVENHFRHLPVVDEEGGVVGLLDIAKCLNDAISKLEKSQGKSDSDAQLALEQAVQAHGAQGPQVAALQALLRPLMSKAFGTKSSPTLRSLLAGKPSTIVHPDTSVMEAGISMADSRKAALVVDKGRLVGIFGFKDMMNRVVAKGLSLEETIISSVMTPNPEAVSPNMTVLEALQTMHDNKFLTLPVCEEGNGAVVGLVNVMDVIYGCGGAEGWRSLFMSTMDLDDLSDDGSTNSGVGSATGGVKWVHSNKSATSSQNGAKKQAPTRPVSKLRPNKPLIASLNDSVLSVTQMLASKRGSASLVVGDKGDLAGIVTDTDITRRLVARHLNPTSTNVSMIMTPSPTCVSMTDSAMDALSTMVENHFRHLPVVDERGGVVGLLDIAKCLNDAISKLEKCKPMTDTVMAQQALEKAMQAQGAQGAQAAALQALLGPLMSQAFGSKSSPTLRSLLAGKPSTIVDSATSLLEVGTRMAESRKAALVVEDGKLVGIFGFKDMMNRVVAKELPLEHTVISDVMTPNPEAVSPDMTVLEALQTMHDNKFLTLPVCEGDGTVVGLVNVMDVIYGCGGAEGWRSIFSSALELDDLSDTDSVPSARGTADDIFRPRSESVKRCNKATKKVANLRPKKAIIFSCDESVLTVTRELANNRGDAAILVDGAGNLAGIFTDTDVTRRVIAKHINPASTAVAEVMTANPKCVDINDSAMEAMMMMVEHRFRHLPVDSDGDVVGILDIARCLNDAISKLERGGLRKHSAAEDMVKQALDSQGGAQAAALHALLLPLLSQAFGYNASIPTLRSILSGRPSSVVSPQTSVLSASIVMAENRKAALIVDDGELVGIFGFRDMMTRVVAKELDVNSTSVSEVMTPEPESVGPETTAIEALQIMHDSKFLTLPVCEENGEVVGLVDVMDVIHGCGDAEHWRSLFNAALEIDDASDLLSSTLSIATPSGKKKMSAAKISKSAPLVTSAIPGNIPSTLEFQGGINEDFDEHTLNDTYRIENESCVSDGNVIVFKVVDHNSHTHRLRSEVKIFNLRNAFAQKARIGARANSLCFKFLDEDGDAILISTDEDLAEAVAIARGANSSPGSTFVVKLSVEEGNSFSGEVDPMILAGLGITVVSLALGAMMLMTRRRY